jgi:hypothetical protein
MLALALCGLSLLALVGTGAAFAAARTRRPARAVAAPVPQVPPQNETPAPQPTVKLANQPTDKPRMATESPPKPNVPWPGLFFPDKVAREPKPPPPAEDVLFVKRIDRRNHVQILALIASAPALSLDRTVARVESGDAVRLAAAARGVGDAPLALFDRRPDLAGLPLRRGTAARLSESEARTLAKASEQLQATEGVALVEKLSEKQWLQADRVPALVQVLTVRPESSRKFLARHLGRIEGARASRALAKMALMDPHPEVRREAIVALKSRHASEYLPTLLAGVNHPFGPVAGHAAEAIVALGRAEAAPVLLAVLDGPDPEAPYPRGVGPARYVRELVRVDHKRNCLLCHLTSLSTTDQPRGEVPSLKEDRLRPKEESGNFGYFAAEPRSKAPAKTGVFVRADVTYLVQDYSVNLDAGKNGLRRYDLFVRERLATEADFVAARLRRKEGQTDQHKAAEFALGELSGEEPGRYAVNWRRFAHKQIEIARRN